MTVEMLDTGVILVSLCEGDMRTYTLDFSDGADADDLRGGLVALLYRVGEICGVDYSGKSCLVEALPAKDGCMLIISLRAVRHGRIYRVKRPVLRDICAFFDCDSMLDYISKRSDSLAAFSLYLYDDVYYLIPDVCSSRTAAQLSEYGRLMSVSPVAVARVRENGRVILRRRSQRRPHSSAAI